MPNNAFAPVEINQNMYNLYTILLQYLKRLLDKNHPKIDLIKTVLDALIILRIDKSIEDNNEELTKRFNEIHTEAYKNINEIYEYDKQLEECKKVEQEISEISF